MHASCTPSQRLNLVDKRLRVRLAPQKVLARMSALRTFASVGTHLEQIHFVPAATRKEDLLAIQLAQLGVERSVLEYGFVHVCGEHERIGVSADTRVI